MRVLIIDPCTKGGICHHTFNLCKALAQQGVETILVTGRGYELYNLPRQFELIELFRDVFMPPTRKARNWLKAVAARVRLFLDICSLLTLVPSIDPDVIHFQWFRTLRVDWIYLALLRHMGYRLVFTAHEVIHPHVSPERYDPFSSRLYRAFSRIVVLTEESGKVLRHRYRVPEQAIHVIPVGNYGFFPQADSENGEKYRDELGLPMGLRVILFFGRITPEKGLTYLIEAFHMVRQVLPETRLLVAGEPQGDFAPYERLLYGLGIQNDVCLHLGYIPFEDVPKYFQVADVVVLPYLKSSQSGVLELALAMGKPLVVSDVGNFREVIPQDAGYVVSPGSAEELVDPLIALLQDERMRLRMAAAALRASQDRLSWQNIAKETMRIYELA